jgi:DNA-binding transcriptional ArsR family regulator
MARTRAAAIEDADEIALLASPTRIEIVDTLEALGSAVTVAELAAALGRPADGLYYHLRQLSDGGLIEEEAAPDGRLSFTAGQNGRKLPVEAVA